MSFGFIIMLMGYVSGWLGAALVQYLVGSRLIDSLLGDSHCRLHRCFGITGVAYTDAYQFGIFMIGNIILVPIVFAVTGRMKTSTDD